MPIDIRMIGKEGRVMFSKWKKEQDYYNSARVRKQFKDKDGNLDNYNNKVRKINEYYRKELKALEKLKEGQKKELEKMRKEEEQNKKEATAIKRRLNKEKRMLERTKQVLRRSSRLVKKEKRSRCPNGTHKNMKTNKCEKKTEKARKRCPNGTRKNKKTKMCEKK